jgi:hypothetical protein
MAHAHAPLKQRLDIFAGQNGVKLRENWQELTESNIYSSSWDNAIFILVVDSSQKVMCTHNQLQFVNISSFFCRQL